MIFKPAWALKASISALVWRIISSIGRSNWKFTGLTLNLVLASASGLLFCFSMKSVGNLTDFVREHMLEASSVEERIQALIGHYQDLDRAHELLRLAKLPPT